MAIYTNFMIVPSNLELGPVLINYMLSFLFPVNIVYHFDKNL
jgi:hypothetical protein